MINVVTVHWQSPKWVEPQLDYLARHLDEPYRVYAALNGIDERALWARFHFAEDLPGTHGQKLNALATIVAEASDPADVLVFLDGDAFPVAPVVPWLHQVLARAPLTAIRRDENLGDRQPHPSFCATTVGFWQEIGGDWRGQPWTNDAGREVVDVGGRLLNALERAGVPWMPLLRTNTANPHPLWFGVYDHRIYHHGAGFQPARAERVEWAERYRLHPDTGRPLRPTADRPSLGTLRAQVASGELRLGDLRPRHVRIVAQATVKTLRLRREHRYFVRRSRSEEGRQMQALNESVFEQLVRDPEFYRQFDATVPEAPDRQP